MDLSEKIEYLKNLGVISQESDLSPTAEQLLDKLTDEEFHAAVTIRAKIGDSKDRDDWDNGITMMGF